MIVLPPIMNITNIALSSEYKLRITNIEANVHFGHDGIGVAIHAKALIGNDYHIMQRTTIGGEKGSCPIIGGNVRIGANSVVFR